MSKLIRISLILFTSIFLTSYVTPTKKEIKTPIINYTKIDNSYATSGSLGKSSVAELKSHGFKKIIDLRDNKKQTKIEKKLSKLNKITYINIPITGANISKADVKEFKKHFEDKENSPILVHCASGNRAGAMLTIYHISEGMEEKEAFKIGRKAGLKPLMEEAIKPKIAEFK